MAATINEEKITEQEITKKLKELQDLIYSEEIRKVVSVIKEKNIVLFIGNTRCGKSTIVNYVIGNTLTAKKNKTGKSFSIINDDNSQGPAIGSGSVSETTLPSVFSSSKIDGVIVDAPGFEDNRGEIQDIANSFYIKEILDNVGAIKLVLVTDIADITNDNITGFISFLDKILQILPQEGQLCKGFIMTFNKDSEGYTKDNIVEMLKDKIIDKPKLKIKNRQLVEYLIKNDSQIAIIKKPSKEGIIDPSEVFGNLIETIKSNAVPIKKAELNGIVPGISDKSRIALLEAHKGLTELKDFGKGLQLVYEEFKKSLNKYNMPKESRSSEEAKTQIREINEIEKKILNAIVAENQFLDKLQELKILVPNTNLLDENSDIHMRYKFITFIDETLNNEGVKRSKAFDYEAEKIFRLMLEQATTTRIRLQERAMEISEEEANKKIKEALDKREQDNSALTLIISKMMDQNTQIINRLLAERRSRCSIS